MTIKRLKTVPLSERPIHPRYGAALGGDPYDINGVILWPFRRGIGLYVRASADGRVTIFNESGAASTVCVDGVFITNAKGQTKRFRYFERAAEAAIAMAQAKGGTRVV